MYVFKYNKYYIFIEEEREEGIKRENAEVVDAEVEARVTETLGARMSS